MSAGIVAIAGKPASGKSLLTARCLVAEWKAGNATVLFDPTGDLSRYMRDFGVPADMLVPVNSISAVSTARDRLAKRTRENPPIIVLHSKDHTQMLYLAERWLYIAAGIETGVCYACDEAELLFPPYPHGATGVGPIRAAILTIARNCGSRIYLATKRPQRLHIDARENATHVCVFRSDSDAFIAGCANFGRVRDYERAKSLEQGEYLYRGAFVKGDALPIYDGMTDPLPFEPLGVS